MTIDTSNTSTSYNDKELRRLIGIDHDLGAILESISDIESEEEINAKLEEYLAYTANANVSVINKVALDRAKLFRKADSVEDKKEILSLAIKKNIHQLAEFEEVYGRSSSAGNAIIAGRFKYSNGSFYFDDNKFDISGKPAKLLLAFFRTPDFFLSDETIESIDSEERSVGSAVSRIDHLKAALAKTPAGRYCVERVNYRFGYRLIVD